MNMAILDSFFEKEREQFNPNFKPLDGHQITDDYRTKMVDWMVEVCTSFQCSDRTWFLAVALFDQYIGRVRGQRLLKNSDVHAIGISAMYISSKYEDVFPFSSYIAFERISHKAVSQKEILRMEGEFYRLLEFQLEFVTAFDFHQYILGFLTHRHPNEAPTLKKVDELSLLLIRMAL